MAFRDAIRRLTISRRPRVEDVITATLRAEARRLGRRCIELERRALVLEGERDVALAELAQECRVRNELAAEVWAQAPGRPHSRRNPNPEPLLGTQDDNDDSSTADAGDATNRGIGS